MHPRVRSEGDVLTLALSVAARHGDPDPELIQHTIASRLAATRTTGSWVESEEPSYLIAIRGDFTTPRPPGPPRLHRPGWENEAVSFPVQVLVVELASGRVTDSGGDHRYPDLASVGPVITDYRASAPLGGQHWRRLRLRWHRRRVIAHAAAIRPAGTRRSSSATRAR
jgi:hypothetical protein